MVMCQELNNSMEELIDRAKREGVQIVDLRFVDLHGLWHHFSIPLRDLTPDMTQHGIGFDGSSVAGFQTIQESDMLLKPASNGHFIDPFARIRTLNVLCNVFDPITHQPYTRDPRYVAHKAEKHLQESGIADTAFFGPEAEFYILDSITFDQGPNFGRYSFDSMEGFWNSGKGDNPSPNLGHRSAYKKAYFPVPPLDGTHDIRSDMITTLEGLGIPVEVHHHEVGSGGQAEIDLRYDSLLAMADKMMTYKYVVKNVALRHQKTVTFMPKINSQDNGSGMHVHVSLWKGGQPLFYQEGGYADLSELAINFIGGVLEHAAALLAFCAPTTNSYRRLVPGFEAPVNLMYSQRNRSACVRIPMYSLSPKAKRMEFRCPDPTANPYLALPALLMAGLDGINRKTVPPAPLDKDLYELPAGERQGIKSTPGSLTEALQALESDHAFLTTGGVFTKDLIDKWLSLKWEEVTELQSKPHPFEFSLYSHL